MQTSNHPAAAAPPGTAHAALLVAMKHAKGMQSRIERALLEATLNHVFLSGEQQRCMAGVAECKRQSLFCCTASCTCCSGAHNPRLTVTSPQPWPAGLSALAPATHNLPVVKGDAGVDLLVVHALVLKEACLLKIRSSGGSTQQAASGLLLCSLLELPQCPPESPAPPCAPPTHTLAAHPIPWTSAHTAHPRAPFTTHLSVQLLLAHPQPAPWLPILYPRPRPTLALHTLVPPSLPT